MPRYYFHLYDNMVVLDPEAAELPGLAEAGRRARATARQLTCAEVLEGHLALKHGVEIVEEAGARVWTVHFRDVVAISE